MKNIKTRRNKSQKTQETAKKIEKPLETPTLTLSNQKMFWIIAAIIALLSVIMLAKNIDRPFEGLHSWGRSHAAWVARSHVKYGLGYTHGFDTFALGIPPESPPIRYLDHPQGRTWLDSLAMLITGPNEMAIRLPNLIATFLTVLMFIKLLADITDKRLALLAGFFFAAFPLTGYFGVWGVSTWFTPAALLTIWYYLITIGTIKKPNKKRYKWILAALLFIILQMTWEGFFVAFAIGLHFVAKHIKDKKMPSKTILAILIVAPLSSMFIDFLILSAGRGWNFHEIMEIAKWRATSGEIKDLTWARWFDIFEMHAITNFTTPILILALLSLTLGQIYILINRKNDKINYLKFPQFCLFTLPALFQLFILRGALVPHQYWERPIAFPIAIACAIGILIIYDIIKKADIRLAMICSGIILAVLFTFAFKGTLYYYDFQWQPTQKIQMFKALNKKIAPDQKLLSFQELKYDQHKYKAASVQCEIAWYLDRQIDSATSLNEILQKAATGKYPYYLIPYVKQLEPLINELARRFNYELVEGQNGERTKTGLTFKGGMQTYFIFDLTSPKNEN